MPTLMEDRGMSGRDRPLLDAPRGKTPRSRNKHQLILMTRGKKAVEEEDPEWVKEAQARFLYAMHEMEWLGFIRGSGRKTDHVFRTSFDAS